MYCDELIFITICLLVEFIAICVLVFGKYVGFVLDIIYVRFDVLWYLENR